MLMFFFRDGWGVIVLCQDSHNLVFQDLHTPKSDPSLELYCSLLGHSG